MYYTVTQPANPAYLAKCHTKAQLVACMYDNGCFVQPHLHSETMRLLAQGATIVPVNGFVIEVC